MVHRSQHTPGAKNRREGDFSFETKTFDLVLTTLMRASGEYADASNWWPGRKEVEAFDELVKTYWTEMHFLWLLEKGRLAVCRVEDRHA
jgi:hypothetical protein